MAISTDELVKLQRPKSWVISNSWKPGAMTIEVGGHRWVEHNIDGTVSVAVKTHEPGEGDILTDRVVIACATGPLGYLDDLLRDKAYRIWWIAIHDRRKEVSPCREPGCELCQCRIVWIMPVTDAPGHWRQTPASSKRQPRERGELGYTDGLRGGGYFS